MQAKYLAASPYNLVRVILGERRSRRHSVRQRLHARREVSGRLDSRRHSGAGSAARVLRLLSGFRRARYDRASHAHGLHRLGKVEDYSAGVVYRHEQTLSGPKKDRLELLRHTRAHFGQIFMLYPDREGAVDQTAGESRGRASPCSMFSTSTKPGTGCGPSRIQRPSSRCRR